MKILVIVAAGWVLYTWGHDRGWKRGQEELANEIALSVAMFDIDAAIEAQRGAS